MGKANEEERLSDRIVVWTEEESAFKREGTNRSREAVLFVYYELWPLRFWLNCSAVFERVFTIFRFIIQFHLHIIVCLLDQEHVFRFDKTPRVPDSDAGWQGVPWLVVCDKPASGWPDKVTRCSCHSSLFLCLLFIFYYIIIALSGDMIWLFLDWCLSGVFYWGRTFNLHDTS